MIWYLVTTTVRIRYEVNFVFQYPLNQVEFILDIGFFFSQICTECYNCILTSRGSLSTQVQQVHVHVQVQVLRDSGTLVLPSEYLF